MNLLIASFITIFSMSSFAFSEKNILSIQKVSGKVKLEIDVMSASNSLVDLLFVVDDSGSMNEYQNILSKNADILTKRLTQYGADVNAAVITTTTNFDNAGQFVGGRYTKSNDPNFELELSQFLKPGVNGNGIEMHFDSIKAALSEPLLSGSNKGFMRENAKIGIIFLSDAEDQSEMTVNELTQFLMSTKQSKDNVFVSGAIVPTQSPSSCPSDDPSLKPVKIEGLISNFNGKTVNLCDPNFGENLSLLVEPIEKEINHNIKLPYAAKMETIKVSQGDKVFLGGDVNNGWVYDSATQTLQLGKDIIFTGPVSNKLIVEFVPLDWD